MAREDGCAQRRSKCTVAAPSEAGVCGWATQAAAQSSSSSTEYIGAWGQEAAPVLQSSVNASSSRARVTYRTRTIVAQGHLGQQCHNRVHANPESSDRDKRTCSSANVGLEVSCCTSNGASCRHGVSPPTDRILGGHQ